MLLVGARPRPVEDVFAVRMAFDIQRASRDQCVAIPQRHETGHPACSGGGAAAFVQGHKVLMPHERGGVALVGEQCVPVRGIHLQRRSEDAGDNGSFSHACLRVVLPAAGLCWRFSTWPQKPNPVP
ncbi:hypothetical protein D3C71_1475140 [compost metagenome]